MPKPIGRLGLCRGYGGKMPHKALIHGDKLCINCYRKKHGYYLRSRRYIITFMRRHPGRRKDYDAAYVLKQLESE